MKEITEKRINEAREALMASARVSGYSVEIASGVFGGESNLALTESIENLHHQIPASVVDIKVGLDNSVSKLIDSNEKLARSQDKHSRAMFWLTIALVSVGILQVVSQIWVAYISRK